MAFLIAVGSAWIILYGNYAWVESTTKICAGALVFLGYLRLHLRPAPAEKMVHFFIFDMPKGSG